MDVMESGASATVMAMVTNSGKRIGYCGYPGYAIILIATREALVVHITTAGTIAPTGVIAVTTERIIGADGGTGRMGPRALASLIGRIELSQPHRNTS